MNCFPCTGPGCNVCGKFDRTTALVRKDHQLRCANCGRRIDLDTGRCEACGAMALPQPGRSLEKEGTGVVTTSGTAHGG